MLSCVKVTLFELSTQFFCSFSAFISLFLNMPYLLDMGLTYCIKPLHTAFISLFFKHALPFRNGFNILHVGKFNLGTLQVLLFCTLLVISLMKVRVEMKTRKINFVEHKQTQTQTLLSYNLSEGEKCLKYQNKHGQKENLGVLEVLSTLAFHLLNEQS